MPLVRSFPPIASKNARLLILGTMPGVLSLAAGQYYAHPRNAFWPIAGAMFGFDARGPYRRRVAALRRSGVAVWDVLACCERDGSLDSDIAPASMQPNDFASFFTAHPRVLDVFCNGGTAHRLFTTRVAPQLAAAPELRIHRLPSTSPAHAGRPFAAKLAAWRAALAGVMLALALPLAAQEKDAPKPVVPATPVAASDGAAVAYRAAVARMKEQFGERCERMPESPLDGGDLELSLALATSAEWRAAVAAAPRPLAQWDLAMGEPKCRFRATSSEPLATEFLQDVFLGLVWCRRLVVARGLQAIAAGDADAAVATAGALLTHASHLRQEPGTIAWMVAAACEKQAVALHDEIVRSLPEAAAARSRAAIRRHLAARPGVAAAGAAVRIELFRLFDGTIAQMKRGDDAKAKIARELADDVRRRFTEIVDPTFAVLDKAADEWTPELGDDLAARGKQLRARFDERMKILKPLLRDAKTAPAGIEPAADLALLLASMLVTDLESFVAAQNDALERLRAVGR